MTGFLYRPKLFCFPPGVRFLDALAAHYVSRSPPGSPEFSRGLILLPTRRAARGLADAFLRVTSGQSLLLPRITSLGAVDEIPLALSGAAELPPVAGEEIRLALLSQLILKLEGQKGVPATLDQAWALAIELAALLDEAALSGVDINAALTGTVAPEFAMHWQQTLDFLQIVTKHWPDMLAPLGMLDRGRHQAELLRAQAEKFEANPPENIIIAAGINYTHKAAASLLSVIARLPKGEVIFPNFETVYGKKGFAALDPVHPQTGFADLLADLHAEPEDVEELWVDSKYVACDSARMELVRGMMASAAELPRWREAEKPRPKGMEILRSRDSAQEARAIALLLRNACETAGKTAALVTPDRQIAARVIAELERLNLYADDSAGTSLADSPAAVFLRLLAQAADLRSVSLLSCLKNPLAHFGMTASACRMAARKFELKTLRGRGLLAGWRDFLAADADPDFIATLQNAFAPLTELGDKAAPAQYIEALLKVAEAAATSPETPGAEFLWRNEDGEALAAHFSKLLPELGTLPAMARSDIEPFIAASLAPLRLFSALGRPRGVSAHPRIFIWGVMEARLQSADLIVMAGLTEGVWPAFAESGPWLNGTMRKKAGLAPLERRIAEAAFDFSSLMMSAAEIILSSPARRDGVPAVPSRWLVRLEAFLGKDQPLALSSAAAWADQIDRAAEEPKPSLPPQPKPALSYRPRRLSVTEIETLLIDPYAIYARHILNLRELEDIEAEGGPADFGDVVHAALAKIPAFKDQADLNAAFAASLAEAQRRGIVTEAQARWWSPLFVRISAYLCTGLGATYMTGVEMERSLCEIPVQLEFNAPGGKFLLSARIDRAEITEDGTISLIDIKTGMVPSEKAVSAGFAPQLPLEAVILQHNGAAGVRPAEVISICYIKLTGRDPPGDRIVLFGNKPETLGAVIDRQFSQLQSLIAAYDEPGRAYLAQPLPGRTPRFAKYPRLARIKEWASAEDPVEPED